MYPTGPRKVDHRILGFSGAAVACPADTTEDILATVAIPAELMGPNGIIILNTFWTVTNSANNKTLRARLGGIGGAFFWQQIFTTVVSIQDRRVLMNRGLQTSQLGIDPASANAQSTAAANFAGVINTAQDTTLVITGQKQTAGENLTLEGFICELYRPDSPQALI